MLRPSLCVVCGSPGAVSAVEVAGDPVCLCASHLGLLGEDSPRVYASLSELFARPGLERRVEVDRRHQDRRMFPPRPELRRQNDGRRSDDPGR